MFNSSDSRGIDLRYKLEKAANNAVVTIPVTQNDFGEYCGPILLKKPTTLIGNGDKTPIFGKGFPAIVILSPGVKLKNIFVADSFDVENRVSLLIKAGCEPELIGVTIKGKKETVNQELLIDLGDFPPLQRTSSYYEIEVSGPSSVKCLESCEKWLRVYPDQLTASGKHILQFDCDGEKLGKDAIGLGEIEISTNGVAKKMWILVHVLPAPIIKLLTSPIVLTIEKKHRYRFFDGFLIGRKRFPGIPTAAMISEKQAILLRDSSNGAWTIYQPWNTIMPTLVNGQPLSQGQRISLQNGTMLTMGALEISVEESVDAGSLVVNKGSLKLSNANNPDNDKDFIIKYFGKGKEKAKIYSTISWLDIKPNGLDLQNGDEKTIAVSLAIPSIINFPIRQVRERSAILVNCNNETWSLDVNLDLKPETISPRTSKNLVKIDNVTDWTKSSSNFTIYNDGAREWKPKARIECDWLTIEPTEITFPAGRSEIIKVFLNQNVEKQKSPGKYIVPIFFEGDGFSIQIQVSIELMLRKAEPVVDTTVLDFKEFGDVSKLIPVSLILKNNGNKEWHAKLITKALWMDVLGDLSFVLPSKGQRTILVQLNNSLRPGKFTVPEALVIEGEDKIIIIGATGHLTPPVTLPDLVLTALDENGEDINEIIFVVDLSNQETFREKIINIQNSGEHVWSGAVRSLVPWITIEPNIAIINPGEFKTFTLRITGGIKALGTGEHNFGKLIVFEGCSLTLAVRVKLVSLPPEIDLMNIEPSVLDFGRFVYGHNSEKSITVSVICNHDWSANIKTLDNYIALDQQFIVGEKDHPVILRVSINDNVSHLTKGVHWTEILLITNNGQKRYLPVKVEIN